MAFTAVYGKYVIAKGATSFDLFTSHHLAHANNNNKYLLKQYKIEIPMV